VSISEVIGQEKPRILLREQIDQRAKAFAAAIVKERTVTVPRVLLESIRPPGGIASLSELPRVHHGDGLRPENLSMPVGSAAKVRNQETRHVRACREERTC
jgi:hypothetical protein